LFVLLFGLVCRWFHDIDSFLSYLPDGIA